MHKGKAMKKRITYIMVILSLISILALQSCKSIPNVSNEIEWATFPSPYVHGVSVVTYTQDTDSVSMPLWYWLKVTEYVIDTEKNIEILESQK